LAGLDRLGGGAVHRPHPRVRRAAPGAGRALRGIAPARPRQHRHLARRQDPARARRGGRGRVAARGRGALMARTIRNVPVKHLQPAPGFVLVTQYDTTELGSGIVMPDTAKVVVQVAKKVGKGVEHVREGDLVILREGSRFTGVPEIKGQCALVHHDAIAGVIRDYDWRSAVLEATPKLVS